MENVQHVSQVFYLFYQCKINNLIYNHIGYKIVKKNCLCSLIDGCMDCPDEKTCIRCQGTKKLNITYSPHACLDKCP